LYRRPALLAGVSMMILASHPAAAQGMATAAGVAVGIVGLLVGAGAVVFGLGAARRRDAAERATEQQKGEAERLRKALAEVPAAVWRREADGSITASTALLRLLSLTETPADIAAILTPQSAAALESAIGRGKFSLDLATRWGQVLSAEGALEGGALSIALRDATQQHDVLRRAEATQAAAEVQLSALTQLPVPVWRRDATLDPVWVNDAVGAALEIPPAKVVSERMEFASTVERHAARALAMKARTSGKRQTALRSLVVAGERRRFRVVETPFHEGTLGIAFDATEEDAARADLKRHIAAHAEVLQNLATAICVFDAGRRLVLHNRAFARLWSLEDPFLEQQPTHGELLEHLREHRRLPEQADWQLWKQQRNELFTTVLEPREELMHLPDERTLRVVTTPHPFGGLLVTYEDVTNQFVLERARNTLVAVQRATLDNLYEGVAVFRGDGRLELWNPAFIRIWRLAPKLLEGVPHIDEIVDALRPMLADGEDWETTRTRITGPFHDRERTSGRVDTAIGKVIDYATVPLPDGAMLFTFWDVTDSVNVERALIDRNQALQAADQLKSEFIANVSHELRTPLNTVIGFGEILVNQYFGDLNARQREYAEGILESSHILLHLIDDILDLATIEAGHMALALKPIDVNGLLDGVAKLARHRAREKELALELECEPDVGLIVADERRIRQVLFNLVSNAIKFTPPGGRITLAARKAGDEVDLVVSDTGIGIPEEERAIAFDRFSKGRAGHHQQGAGLGLALVKSFIELHGGQIDLVSTPDRGTTVTCRLPSRAGQAAA
jgi:signal transduction histidine kinase